MTTTYLLLSAITLQLCLATVSGNIALNRPTMQSSQGFGGLPARGVDGNVNSNWGGASCTHTGNTQGAWWAVDLGSGAQVSSVIITNRKDCCSHRLSNFRVGLTDTDPRSSAPTLSSYTPCAKVSGALSAGETRAIECSGRGRFLVVQLEGRNYLTLCEVAVIGERNIAINRPAMQSSQGFGGLPARGVDGNKNSNWGGASCTHTGNTQGAWWAVDLGSGAQVSSVIITNRKDCCSNRLSNFRVGLTDTDPRSSAPALTSSSACASVSGALSAGETRSIACSGKGRFLVVQLQGRNYLTLCEVEVIGARNLALKKPTMQSSQGFGGLPARGVDGNVNSNWGGASCTHTGNTQGAWWAVDLGAGAQVHRVVITNRKDCCSNRLSNFRVGLTDTDPNSSAPALTSDSACATVSGALGAGESRSIACSGKGRFLVVQLQGRNYLTLCEVEVLGE